MSGEESDLSTGGAAMGDEYEVVKGGCDMRRMASVMVG